MRRVQKKHIRMSYIDPQENTAYSISFVFLGRFILITTILGMMRAYRSVSMLSVPCNMSAIRRE
jgi:hypothetical protein